MTKTNHQRAAAAYWTDIAKIRAEYDCSSARARTIYKERLAATQPPTPVTGERKKRKSSKSTATAGQRATLAEHMVARLRKKQAWVQAQLTGIDAELAAWSKVLQWLRAGK